MKTLLSVWLTIWYLNISVNANNEKALIFNRAKNSLIAAPTENLHGVKCNTWVTACPAEDEDELKFEEEFSFHNAALFVKRIYNEENSCSNFRSDVCSRPYKLSMAWFKETIEFGYEIFLKKSEHEKHKFDVTVYDSHEPLRYFLELESSSWADFFKKLIEEMKKGETELKFKDDQEMVFIWIPLFKVWFKANRVRKIEYQIRKSNMNAKLECADYNLGNELFYGADVDLLYDEKTQEKALDGFQVPSSEEYNGCESKYKCFKKWLLIPADQFQFNSPSNISCSNIATIAIWSRTIERILQKVDDYLYALSRVCGETLRIVAGVSEILQLPYIKQSFFRPKNYVYFTHEKFSIRPPNIIYKIVKVKTNRCELGIDEFCWYGVIIVIHNDPYYDEKKPICEDLSETLGWTEIKYEKLSSEEGQNPSKFIYVCKINNKSIEGIGLTYDWHLHLGELSLFEFPDEYSEEYATKNVINEVYGELKRLTEEGSESKVEDSRVIERPSIHDEDFDLESDADDQNLNDTLYGDSEQRDKKTD